MVRYFQGLFTSSNPQGVAELVSVVTHVISAYVNQLLVRDIEAAEAWEALKQMHPSKSPGPDGFAPGFYQQFWHIVGADVVMAVRCFIGDAALTQQINSTSRAGHKTHGPKKDLKNRPDLAGPGRAFC